MNGIERARFWYDIYGRDMLAGEFGHAVGRIAVGIAGSGSECFGFDDEISTDHDYGTGFSLWITAEDDRESGLELRRKCQQLFRKLKSELPETGHSDGGRISDGVMQIGEFYRRHLGIAGVPENWQQWLMIPEYAFAEAVNGEVFRDDAGIFSAIRNGIKYGMPEDIRLKKLSYHAIMMAQSGQYNYSRCLKHGEYGAAGLALAEFVRHAGALVFILNHTFAPYYKWMFRAMKQLPVLPELSVMLAELLCSSSDGEKKCEAVDRIASVCINELVRQDLTRFHGDYLEPYARELLERISNRELRQLHIMDPGGSF